MRKILSLLLVLAVILPAFTITADAAPRKFKASDVLTAEEKADFDAISYPRLGREYVYLNKDLTEASFTRTKECKKAYSIHYICLCNKIFKRRPGTCPCKKALVPAFKHANNWYHISRNERGALVIKPATTEDCCSQTKSDCSSCSSCK